MPSQRAGGTPAIQRMNLRERFAAAMRFEPVDRLPAIESYWYWPETLKRWYAEGLPAHLLPPPRRSTLDRGSDQASHDFGSAGDLCA